MNIEITTDERLRTKFWNVNELVANNHYMDWEGFANPKFAQWWVLRACKAFNEESAWIGKWLLKSLEKKEELAGIEYDQVRMLVDIMTHYVHENLDQADTLPTYREVVYGLQFLHYVMQGAKYWAKSDIGGEVE
jgi:hypothetical protein